MPLSVTPRIGGADIAARASTTELEPSEPERDRLGGRFFPAEERSAPLAVPVSGNTRGPVPAENGPRYGRDGAIAIALAACRGDRGAKGRDRHGCEIGERFGFDRGLLVPAFGSDFAAGRLTPVSMDILTRADLVYGELQPSN